VKQSSTSLMQLAAVYFPPLMQVLRTVPLTMADWRVVGLGAFTPFVAMSSSSWGRRVSGLRLSLGGARSDSAKAPRLVSDLALLVGRDDKNRNG
jgi:hypothetical protein